jgi:glycosyltransferase involved in cell wall biosynthesis
MDDNTDLHCQEASERVINKFSLPLVSVIIVNYNYGRFLKQAADSIFEQTYPSIECIIVDNASTDCSAAVLLDISRQYPGAKIVRRKDPGGQSLASKEGFEASSGEYVVFLDADDYLLASFVETHVFVHLSLRVPVGFSSSDMIQAVDSRMVLGTVAYLSAYVRSGRGKTPGLLRRIDKSAPEVWPLPSPGASIETEVHFVKPRHTGDWMWAPTSGNCFRRDALQLFLNNEHLAPLRTGTDAYLIRGVNVVTGNVVIDRPLGVYRLHGMNEFSKHPHLNGVLNYDRNSPSDPNRLGRKMIIDHLIANARLFLRKIASPWRYMNALKAVDDPWPRLPSTVAGCRSYLAGRVVAEARALAPALGMFNFIVLLARLKVAPPVILRACLECTKEKRS